ncbi:DUF6470 family protein [Lysinibacillus telephonicus]|uniref:DUF6470 family protein n=1 Tax=Lysinibacillus telephonicus TaxID=1714840 RepID=UPI001FEB237A|nr:DUF6470 family protein [Lysinibacillus telephonicus]
MEGDKLQFPRIQIKTTDTKLDLNIQDSIQIIKQPKADLKIEQPAAIVEINKKDGTLHIDSTQARRDLGYFPMKEVVQKYAQEGRQEMLKGISRRVREGNQMMMTAGKHQDGAVFQQIAKQNHGPKRPGPYNIKFVPSVGSVKIDYIPGSVDINIQKRNPEIDAKVNKPIHDYQPGKVTGTIVQRPSIEIDVIG